MNGCDDAIGNDLYRLDYFTYYGNVFHDDAIYRDAGASDGTNKISWKMVSNGNAAEFSEPLVSPPIVSEWIETPGSKAFTIHVVRDSTESLQDDELWLEIEYLGGSGSPTITQSTFADNRMADPLGEGASPSGPQNQPASTEAWTGIDAGSPDWTRQQLDVTVTVDRAGPVIARVHLARTSTTVYIDPLLEVA